MRNRCETLEQECLKKATVGLPPVGVRKRWENKNISISQNKVLTYILWRGKIQVLSV